MFVFFITCPQAVRVAAKPMLTVFSGGNTEAGLQAGAPVSDLVSGRVSQGLRV